MAKDKIISDDPHRAALAAAIADAKAAGRNLEIARVAATNAENQMFEAIGKLEELRKPVPANASPDGMLEALAAAAPGCDVHDLEMHDAEAREREAKAENEISAWRRVYAIAEQAIPDREHGVEIADRKVEAAARVFIGSSFDIGKMIAEAEIAAASIVEKRIRLMYIRPLLEDEGDRQAIERFLGRPWLGDEGSEAWKDHPMVVAHRAAYEELLLDASAPLPA